MPHAVWQGPLRAAQAPDPRAPRRYRRGIWLQIYLPLIGGALLAGAALAGIVTAVGGGSTSVWADVSLLLLTAPCLVAGLLALALFGGLALGLNRVIVAAPPYFHQVQDFVGLVSRRVRQGADVLASPVMKVRSISSAVRSFRGRGVP